MWGCEFPPAAAEWFVNLPPYGFNWWLIGEVDALSDQVRWWRSRCTTSCIGSGSSVTGADDGIEDVSQASITRCSSKVAK